MSSYRRSFYPLLAWVIANLALAVNLAPAAMAAETAWSAGYRLEYTDNAQLAPNNLQEEWTNVLSAGVSLLENNPSLDAKVQAQASYRNYKNGVFPDETVFGLGSSALWKISPDRFNWTVEDYLTQTSILSLGPDTPSNRQQLNVFSTGPDFKVRLSTVQALQFGARYARNTYETSDLDNTRHAGELKWTYQASSVTNLSLNYNAQTVRYDNSGPNTNFDRQDTFLQIEERLARNIFVLSAGTTSIQQENLPDEEGSLGRFSWTRIVSPVSTFNLSLASELTDIGRQALANGQTASGIQTNIPGVSNTGDVFRTNSVIATFNHRRSFGNDSISLFKAKDEYNLLPVVEERKGGSIDIGYEFAGTLAASVFARYTKTESNIRTPATEFKDKNYGLRLSDRFARNFTVGLELGRNQRDSADFFQSYTERHAILILSYTESNNSGTALFK